MTEVRHHPMLMSELCELYLTDYARQKKTRRNDAHVIQKHILPALGNKQVTRVCYTDICEIHEKMRDRPYQANRVVSILHCMFGLTNLWMVTLPHGNPCRKVKRYREYNRTRFLSDDELRRLIDTLDLARAGSPLRVGFLELLLYTGARCGEWKTARWDQIRGRELSLQDSKTGPRTIYLTAQAMEVLAGLPKTPDGLVFPELPELRYFWTGITKKAKIANLRLHDLRHCFASVALSAGQSLPKIGGLLGHTSPKMTARYAHLVPSEGRASANAIGKKFESIILME